MLLTEEKKTRYFPVTDSPSHIPIGLNCCKVTAHFSYTWICATNTEGWNGPFKERARPQVVADL